MKTLTHLKNLSIAAVLVTAYSCSKPQGAPAGMAGQVREYAVLEIASSDIVLSKDYPTSLQGEQTVDIRPRVAGYIESILVDEGDFVTKGQVLFRLNANDLQAQVRSAEAQVKVAESTVNTAEINLKTTQPLVEKNIISEYQLESVNTALKSAQAQLAQANANLANAKANLAFTVITSPTNGIIGTFPYRVGSLVSSAITEPLTTVSNTGSMQAYFSINEKDFLALIKNLPGKTTKEKLESLPPVSLVMADNTVYSTPGKIETASGIVDPTTGAVNIRASFPNPEGLLRSGGSGKVRLPENYTGALLVPQKATYDIQGKHFVYVVNAENKVVNTPIEAHAGNLKDTYVVTSGLNIGDKIVVEGISSLRDGTEIKPKLAGAAPEAKPQGQETTNH
ncbi:MAG: efflux RND transporter periplasmic adaptor subunit [Mangrovibacterium sp.]